MSVLTLLRSLCVSCLICCSQIQAQSTSDIPTVDVLRTEEKIVIDGELNEAIWQKAVPAGNFWQWFPNDTSYANYQTEIRMAFDDQFLYVGVICHSAGDNYITTSLKRDYRASEGDNVTLVFDPFLDNTNAVIFGMNPFGVQREALVSGGGRIRQDFQTSWDNKWYGEASRHPDRWVAEFAIPFKTLRFREGQTQWYFNSYRFDTQANERSTWIRIPRNLMVMDRAYNGIMQWESAPPKPGKNISVIPFALGGLSRDYEEGSPVNRRGGLGGDVKVALSPSLSLDMTVNPDFSQVEVDQQVTNLDRFEIFFPEKRQFFLENSDLFANLGTDRVRPFFSRRIGVAIDTATGQNLQNPIFYGLRVSGKLNAKWRTGLLNMQTASDASKGVEATNFTVASLQRQLGRSFISAFVVNKQGTQDAAGNFTFSPEAFNRVAGVDYNLATVSNFWRGKFFAHRSQNEMGGGIAQGSNLSYTRRHFQLTWDQQWVQDSYEAETGFTPRDGYIRMAPEASIFIYPDQGAFNFHSPGVKAELITDEEFGKTDHKYSLSYSAWMKNTSRFEVNLNHNYIRLLDEFDPSRSDLIPFPTGTEFNYVDIDLTFDSDRRKKLYALGTANIGQYFNGNRFSLACSLGYRIQPLGVISAVMNVNQIQLTPPGSTEKQDVSLYLIGPRFDFTFSRKLFFTTLFQYNSQLDNLNINARLQWRFKPVSDFFLVYTDNYLTATGFSVRNRAVVAKLTYWLNL